MPKKRKKCRVPKTGPVWHRTAEEATLDQMPKFNAHACGTGTHGDVKYNRARLKRSWHDELRREARNRGPLGWNGAALGAGTDLLYKVKWLDRGFGQEP